MSTGEESSLVGAEDAEGLAHGDSHNSLRDSSLLRRVYLSIQGIYSGRLLPRISISESELAVFVGSPGEYLKVFRDDHRVAFAHRHLIVRLRR